MVFTGPPKCSLVLAIHHRRDRKPGAGVKRDHIRFSHSGTDRRLRLRLVSDREPENPVSRLRPFDKPRAYPEPGWTVVAGFRLSDCGGTASPARTGDPQIHNLVL